MKLSKNQMKVLWSMKSLIFSKVAEITMAPENKGRIKKAWFANIKTSHWSDNETGRSGF